MACVARRASRRAGPALSAHAVPAGAANRAPFPNSVDPETDFGSIGRGKCERGRDPQFGATIATLQTLRVSAASRGKTARGWSPEISPLGAAVPAFARRRASPTGGSAATASHGHSCHAFGCPFLRDLAASIKSSIGDWAGAPTRAMSIDCCSIPRGAGRGDIAVHRNRWAPGSMEWLAAKNKSS